MFRRNPGSQNAVLTAGQIATLAAANKLMSEGNPAEAGPLFVKVADDMQASHHPRRAANLYARAASAYVDSGNGAAALRHARAALSLFAQFRMAQRGPVFLANITQKMSDKGMNPAAAALQREFGAQIASRPPRPQPREQPRRGLLPTNCPK